MTKGCKTNRHVCSIACAARVFYKTYRLVLHACSLLLLYANYYVVIEKINIIMLFGNYAALFFLGRIARSISPFSRQHLMAKITPRCIAGTLLENITIATDLLSCQRQCASLSSCIYAVSDKLTDRCELYTSGKDVFPTADKEVFNVTLVNEQVYYWY